jgi:hypothetical protein
VIDVGDWYHFRRPDAMRPVMSLDDIDTQFEKQKRYQQEANKKYHKITSALGRLVPVSEGGEEFNAPDSFGAKAVKGGRGGAGKSSAAAAAAGGGEDDADEGGEDDHAQAFEALANEEFEKGASDDEEDAKLFQMVDIDREENDTDALAIWDELGDDDSSDEEEDSDEEREEADRPSLKVDSLVLAGSELKDHLAASAKAQAPGADKNKKRRRDVAAGSTSGAASRNAAEEGSGNEDSRSPKVPRVGSKDASSSPAGASSASSKGGLTEDMVRQVMTRLGGRVASKTLVKVRDSLICASRGSAVHYNPLHIVGFLLQLFVVL